MKKKKVGEPTSLEYQRMKTQMNFRLSNETIDMIEEIAKHEGISYTRVIELSLAQFALATATCLRKSRRYFADLCYMNVAGEAGPAKKKRRLPVRASPTLFGASKRSPEPVTARHYYNVPHRGSFHGLRPLVATNLAAQI